MIATRWYEEIMDALDGRWSTVMDDGLSGAVGACMYFCSVALLVAALFV